jgi:hypothetical protein
MTRWMHERHTAMLCNAGQRSTPAISIVTSTATNNPATVGIAVSIASADTETRPANMSVVWMMRVR